MSTPLGYLDLAVVLCKVIGAKELPHFHHCRDRNDGIQNFLIECIVELGTKIAQDFKILKDDKASLKEIFLRKSDKQTESLTEILKILRTIHQNLDYLKSGPKQKSVEDLQKTFEKDLSEIKSSLTRFIQTIETLVEQIDKRIIQLDQSTQKLIQRVVKIEARLEVI